MKTFQQFKEDMTSVQDTMKGFAKYNGATK